MVHDLQKRVGGVIFLGVAQVESIVQTIKNRWTDPSSMYRAEFFTNRFVFDDELFRVLKMEASACQIGLQETIDRTPTP